MCLCMCVYYQNDFLFLSLCCYGLVVYQIYEAHYIYDRINSQNKDLYHTQKLRYEKYDRICISLRFLCSILCSCEIMLQLFGTTY